MVESDSDANLRIYLEYLARECAEKLLPAGCQDASPVLMPVLVCAGLAACAFACVAYSARRLNRS